MRKLLPVLLLLIMAVTARSQTASIKGTVTDTVEKKNLSQSVVVLIRKTDSVLVKYTRTDHNGNFFLNNLPAGNFILMATHPTFADYVDEIRLTDKQVTVGKLPLTPKSKILEEVIVKQNISIRMKGDTIEYKADSFKVREGATVQDLLRKLPGLQVDKNGQITAQGQKVEKVLVDGEEFFSDDPAVVTQNLRADAVDKVQSFDKKSDQAEFTGVDDGKRSKTLNLVLKDDKKRGYFGKLSLAGGTTVDKDAKFKNSKLDRYSNEAMLNFFRGKKKASVYGIMSNTGKVGLNWDDRDKFGGGTDFGDNVEVGFGFISISSDGSDNDFSDWNSTYSGEGIPVSLKAGAHFSNKWNSDKTNLNGDYSLKRLTNGATGSSVTKIADTASYYTRENHTFETYQFQQILKGYYDIKLDSISSIRFRLNGMMGNNKNDQLTNSEFDNEDLMPINKSRRQNITNTDSRSIQASVLWKQKLKKKGRTFSLSASHKYADKTSDGYLYSIIDFYNDSNQVSSSDSTDQYKTAFSKSLLSSAKTVYTEPIGKKSIVEINYSFNRNASESNRETFDKLNGKYEALNLAYSNNYGLVYMANSAGLKYQYNGKKLMANVGANYGLSDYQQTDSAGKKLRQYSYRNLYPSARLTYKIAAQKSMNISYTGNPQSPTIDQIQPVFENTDPLNVKLGNPLLKQAFQNSFSFFYNNFQVLTGKNVWINASFAPVNDAIVTREVTEANGKRTLQYVNTDGNFNYWWYGNYGFKLKKLDLNFGLSLNGSGGRTTNFIWLPGYTDTLKNVSNNGRINAGFDINKYKEDKYDFYISSNVGYNRSVSKISSDVKTTYWTQNNNASFNWYISKKWEIGSDIDISLREKLYAFDQNNDEIEWNAHLKTKLFKKNNAVIQLQVFDILDKKKGFDRNFYANTVVEKHYEVLKRYFLLSFTWNFSKNPAQVK